MLPSSVKRAGLWRIRVLEHPAAASGRIGCCDWGPGTCGRVRPFDVVCVTRNACKCDLNTLSARGVNPLRRTDRVCDRHGNIVGGRPNSVTWTVIMQVANDIGETFLSIICRSNKNE